MSAAPGGPTGDGFQPWLGLLPYSEADQELFFGRESDTLDLLRLVRREVLTVLFGRSGTGKSSLLKAGLFPKLRQEQFLPVWIRLDHSGRTSYGRQVRNEIESAVASRGIEVEILNDAVADESEDMWEYVHRVVFWDARNQPVTPVLVFDQFEELFTLGRHRPEIGAFFEELATVAENLIPRRIRDRVVAGDAKLPAAYNERHYKLIISLREDYVSRLDSLARDMPSVMHNRHGLTHMTGSQALEVVLKPGGGLVDEVVARKIVRFVAAANDMEAIMDPSHAEPAASDLEHLRAEPALLSLVCSELNLQRIKEGRTAITLEQVQRSSDQILEDFYERSLEDLNSSDRRFIEDRLVTASGFRTTVPVEEAVIAGLDDEEVEKLVARRLLRKEDRLGTPHIELTHDVLTRVVTRSRSRRQQREEEEARHQQEQQEESERQIIKERETLEAQRLRRIRNVMRAIWGVIALSTALATIVIVLLFSKREVEKARALASARALALNGIDVLHQDPELALLLSIESALTTFPDSKSSQGAPPEIEMALRTATRESLVRRRYEGHMSKIYTVDFDREGRRLVSGAWHPDSTARIWDVDAGKEIARLDPSQLPGGKTTISCARFSPDGRRIVTTTYREDGSVYVWDADSLRKQSGNGPRIVTQPLLGFTGHHAQVNTAAFSPDGKIVATGGYDNMVRLWDPTTGQELCKPLGSGQIRHSKLIRSVAFNADGSQLLSTSDDGDAILWDTRPALQATPLQPSTIAPVALRRFVSGSGEILHDGEFSPSGKWFATVGNDRYLRIWNAATGDQVAARGHPDSVMDVAFIDDDHLVTVCNDSALRFWVLGNAMEESIGSFDPGAGSVYILRLLATQKGHQGWIREVAVSPDHRFVATAGDDATVRLWKTPPGGEMTVMGGSDFESWSADIHFARETPTEPNRLFAYAGTAGGEIRAMDAFTERSLVNWGPLAGDGIRHTKEIRSICVSPDGTNLVTSSSDQTAIVWDAITGRPKFQLTGHKGPAGGTVYQARFSADGKHIVTASNEGCARVWNARTGDAELLLAPDRREFTGGDFKDFAGLLGRLRQPVDPASAYLAARFTAGERAELMEISTASETVQKIVTTRLNQLIREASLVDEPGLQEIVKRPMTLDLAKRNPGENDRPALNRLILEDAFPDELERKGIYDARFSQDGSKIVTADFESRTATVWDFRNGRKLMTFPAHADPQKGHSDNVMSASFSSDGSQVITACMDGFCRIWSMKSGDLEKTIPHGIAVRGAEFNPDGTLVLTAAADGVARLWTMPDGQLRTELRGHTDTLEGARFSNDGDYIVTASRDGTARVYHTHPWWIYKLATERVTRKLTLAEWEQYGITREFTKEEKAYYQKESKGGR